MRTMLTFGALCALLTIGCAGELLGFQTVQGSGTIKQESRDVPDFTEVEVGSALKAVVTVGPKTSVKIEADDNLLSLVETAVKNGRLVAKVRDGFGIKSSKPIELIIATGHLKLVDAKGASDVTVADPKADRFDAQTSGASKLAITGLVSDQVVVSASGASRANLAGQGKKLDVRVSGASNVDASQFTAEIAQIGGSGASRAAVTAGKAVSGNLSGASTLAVAGNPASRKVETSGASTVTYR